MYKQKRYTHSFIEWSYWDKWPCTLFCIELGPEISKNSWSITLGITIFYRVLFYIQYTKFNNKQSEFIK